MTISATALWAEECEKRHRYLWPGGARPVCRSRAWQAPLSSESSRLLRAESQLQEAELGAPSPARLSNYWTPVNSVGSGSQNLPRDWKVSMSIHSHEPTCPVLGTFSDSLGSMPLYLEADDNPQSRSPDTLSTGQGWPRVELFALHLGFSLDSRAKGRVSAPCPGMERPEKHPCPGNQGTSG